MIASLYPMEESKTDIEDGFTEGRPVVVRMGNNHFVCGKSRIRMYDRHGIRRKHELDKKTKVHRTVDRASLGNEHAMRNLSLDDQIRVNYKKTTMDYEEIRDECRAIIKQEKARLGE